MRVLIVHTKYLQIGGEDVVFEKEVALLHNYFNVDTMTFQNKSGFAGLLQFFFSIWDFNAVKKIKGKIQDFKPDVVHIHNTHFAIGPKAIRAVKACQVPLVVTLHNYRLLCPSGILLSKGKLFTESLQSDFPWKAVVDRVYRKSLLATFWLALSYWIHRKIGTWKLPDTYIALTQFSRQLFLSSRLEFSSPKVVVKPNFCESNSMNSNEREKTFLYVGRLSLEKGISILLDAFENSTFELRVVGAGPMEQMVLDACKRSSNIQYLGKLDQDAVRLEMQKCDALIFPSICYETFGLTIIEAFATGTTVIASNIGSASELVENNINGLHFTPGDSDDLRTKLDDWQALSECSKERFRQNARLTYEQHYTPEKNLEQLETIYREVIERHHQKNSNREKFRNNTKELSTAS